MNSITQMTQRTLSTLQTQGTKPKVVAAIPCLNEEQFISDIVTRARRYVDKVIVIDDGSTDNTSEAAQAAGAEVIIHRERQGAGAAIRSAFEAAKTSNADILVTLDGDGQHNPDEIPQVLAPVFRNEADMVIGSRFLLPTQPTQGTQQTQQTNIRRYRKFGIDVITWLYNFGSKSRVSDSQSCFRAHSRRLLEAIDITEKGFGFSVEVLIKARRKGFVIAEVPISCVYHSQGSSLNPVIHGLGVALTVIKLRLKSLLAAG
ncbi:MAG: glycosyltransferase family 2 protein [Chloroflexi bacterium]|nr:glycosyltransferase family 2 protein [Chloroflexota bacterium]